MCFLLQFVILAEASLFLMLLGNFEQVQKLVSATLLGQLLYILSLSFFLPFFLLVFKNLLCICFFNKINFSGFGARELWDIAFALFGVQWMMPRGVVDLLACWQCQFWELQNNKIWKGIPHCLMSCLWRERNARNFEGCEWKILVLNLNFLKTLFE